MRELTVWLLCGLGVYASAFMARKVRRAERGELAEPSVVQQPAARLFFGIPNAYLGLAYYPSVALAFSIAYDSVAVRALVSALIAAAALTSCVLAYDLLAVSRRPCLYCWTSHFVNIALVFEAIALWRN